MKRPQQRRAKMSAIAKSDVESAADGTKLADGAEEGVVEFLRVQKE